jgi:uncharacterized protein (DUF58 family)
VIASDPRRGKRPIVSAVLETDFCPWANRWVYWLKNPFWVLLAAALTAITCGVLVSGTALVLGALLLVLLALGVLWPWISVRGVSCAVRFEHTRIRDGEVVPVEISITNRWPWPVWGLSLVRGFAAGSQGGFALAMVGGWSTGTVRWSFRPEGRGLYPSSPPQLETGFPFGLYVARRPVQVENSLIVWPRRVLLDELPDAVEIESREDRTSDRRAGDVGDVLGTRWFRQGDSLRRVHWAQSARQGRLIVCERQTPISCAMRLVLDLDPSSHGGQGRERSLERLLRVTASIVESMHAQHSYVECVIGEQSYVIGSAAADLRNCLDALAAVPASGLESCHPHGVCCGARGRHRSLSEFVVTTELGLSRQLHRRHWSENHHYVVVGSASTPTPNECHDHQHCACRPWLETNREGDVLTDLPARWRRACRVA